MHNTLNYKFIYFVVATGFFNVVKMLSFAKIYISASTWTYESIWEMGLESSLAILVCWLLI